VSAVKKKRINRLAVKRIDIGIKATGCSMTNERFSIKGSNGFATMSMYQSRSRTTLNESLPGEFLGTPCLHSFPNQTANTKMRDKNDIHIFTTGEQLGTNIDIRTDFTSDV
jgi:hypothetical protein